MENLRQIKVLNYEYKELEDLKNKLKIHINKVGNPSHPDEPNTRLSNDDWKRLIHLLDKYFSTGNIR